MGETLSNLKDILNLIFLVFLQTFSTISSLEYSPNIWVSQEKPDLYSFKKCSLRKVIKDVLHNCFYGRQVDL